MTIKEWSRKLLGSLIQGGSHAGGAYLGLAIAHAADAAIPALNIKGLCVIVVTSAILKAFNFLEANPIPDDNTPKPPDNFTPTGGIKIAMGLISLALLSSCATISQNTTQEKAHEYSQWVKDRQGFIEDAVAGIVRIAVYSSEKDTAERARTLEVMHAIASNLNTLVAKGSVNPDEIKTALKINEPYFGAVMSAVASIIQVELSNFSDNGYEEFAVAILDAVTAGIKDGSTT